MNYKRLKYACYTTNISMSVVTSLSPLLFVTFRNMYGISYSLLGLLILINFVTQLSVDLIFSFFSHRFNIEKTVKITPFLTIIGLCIYALWPLCFPGSIYFGLVLGTIIFSASAGFCEVLISPVIASIPSENPEREMSKLHSTYAWGVVFVVIFSSLFLLLFGREHWSWLTLTLSLIPLCAFVLFSNAKIPTMDTPSKLSGAISQMKNKTLWLCVLMIFFGGASEVAMAQWSSTFLEQALNVPKIWGDILGVALFSVMLGFGRTLYSKIGKNIALILVFGIIGTTVCYLTVAISNNPIIALLGCVITGFCVSMLWPGSLIFATDRIFARHLFWKAISPTARTSSMIMISESR